MAWLNTRPIIPHNRNVVFIKITNQEGLSFGDKPGFLDTIVFEHRGWRNEGFADTP